MKKDNEYIADVISKIIVSELPDNKAKDIKSHTHLYNDLGGDSLDAVSIILQCEIEFNINILDEDAEKIKTVEDLHKLVDSIINYQGGINYSN